MNNHPEIDRPLLGVVLTLCFCIIIPFSDALVKVLVYTVPLLMVLLARFLMQTVLSLPALLKYGMGALKPVLMLIFLRTVLQLLALGFIYLSFRFIPLADAVAISFVAPFLLLMLGKFILGEEVGRRRITACAIGFLGTLLVIQPSFLAVGAAALLPLASAVTMALYTLATRQVVRRADPMVAQGVSGIVGVSLLLLVALLTPIDEFDLKIIAPTTYEAMLLALLAFVGSVAHIFMTWALRFAPASTLAPIQYVEIPFATLIGWLFFRELPNGLAALGIVIIICAGLYIVYRERKLSRLKNMPISS